VGSAVGVTLQLAAASCILPVLPTVTLLTAGVWVGVALGAAALGWFTADDPFGAVGVQLAALLGTAGAIVAGPTFVVAALLIGMAAGAGGLAGYLVAPFVRGAAHPGRSVMPDAQPLLTRERLQDWVNATGLSDSEKVARQHVSRSILDQQISGPSHSTSPIVINGDLNLSNLKGLTQLPAGLVVARSLDISGCTELTHLPAGLSVGRSLYISGCRGLTQLPDGLTVGGDLLAFRCTGLNHLPDGLRVDGSFALSGCKDLTALPNGLKVGDSFYVNNCVRLAHLPDGLHVGGNFGLSGCTDLTRLPAGLHVGKMFTTFGCAKLCHFSEDIQLGHGLAVLRVLKHVQQQYGHCALQNLAFSRQTDHTLRRLPEAELYDVLKITQQLAPVIRDAPSFETVLAALVQVPVAERAALPDVCAPLLRAVGQQRCELFINMFTKICLTPAARHPARVQTLLAKLGGMGAAHASKSFGFPNGARGTHLSCRK
jgi:hypothetical protein